MDTKLIMLIGACPGAGKSTLSAYLAEQLELNQLDARWFYEEAVFYEPSLANLVEKAQGDKLLFAEVVLEAAQKLVSQAVTTNQVYVTDSLFPGFQWLIEKCCSLEELKTFSLKLQDIFKPLKPILIYLNCDVSVALGRAFKHRGAAYQEILFENLRREPARKKAVPPTLQDVFEYWELNNQLNLELLAEWVVGEKLILNTTELTEADSQALLLKHLNLTAYQRTKIDQLDPQIFAGAYFKTGAISDAPAQITIELEIEHLRVNLYWPAGCKLVVRSQTRFQLENIAQYLDFELGSDGLVKGLQYDEGHRVHHYVKSVSAQADLL